MNLTGKKTYVFGMLIVLLGTLQSDPNFQALLGSHAGLVTSIIGFGVLILRSLTTTPPLQSAAAGSVTQTTVVTPPIA